MKDLKTSIVESLDGGANPELYPFLPYLLQDLEEIGTDPHLVEEMVKKHIGNKPLEVLDLGCGKGIIGIRLAKSLACRITGIDGMNEFLEEADKIARREAVDHLCHFRQGDIREQIQSCRDFDLIILGAIGPVFGFIGETLLALSHALKPDGYVIIDDGYKMDGTLPAYDRVPAKSEFYDQIQQSDFEILEERIIPPEEITPSNRDMQDLIVKRATELAGQYPGKAQLFRSYTLEQEAEIEKMDKQLTVGIWILQKSKKKNDCLVAELAVT